MSDTDKTEVDEEPVEELEVELNLKETTTPAGLTQSLNLSTLKRLRKTLISLVLMIRSTVSCGQPIPTPPTMI